MIIATVLGVALGLAASWWAARDSRAADGKHDEAFALWESKEPKAYSFDYSHCSGMCADCRLAVTVTDGVVSRVRGRGQCPASSSDDAPTIEGVFALAEQDLSDAGAGLVQIDYDGTWGFPAFVEVRCPGRTADCGTGYGVTNFQVLS